MFIDMTSVDPPHHHPGVCASFRALDRVLPDYSERLIATGYHSAVSALQLPG
jgi:hypothetical protein